MRRHRVGVGRRAQQLAGVGLEVPLLVDVDGCRPGRGLHARWHGEGEGRAPARLQADGRHAGQARQLVGPGTGGVHYRACAQHFPTGQRDGPAAWGALQRGDFGIRAQHGAAPPRAAQVALVQRMHVDVGGIGLQHAGGHGLGPQAGQQGQQLVAREQTHGRVALARVFEGCMQRRQLLRPRHIGHAARGEDGGVPELRRRRVVEGAAGTRQGLNVGRAVSGAVERRRAAGSVVAGLGFALQQQHAPRRSQFPGYGRTGNARADDHEVAIAICLRHAAPLQNTRS